MCKRNLQRGGYSPAPPTTLPSAPPPKPQAPPLKHLREGEIPRPSSPLPINETLLQHEIQRPEINRLRDENAALRAEIDRLRADLHTQADWAKGEMERLRSERDESRARFYAVVGKIPADMVAGTLQDARNEYLKTLRILDKLREPSLALEAASHQAYVLKIGQIYTDEGHVARHHQTLAINSAIRAAVAAAEQEVGRE